MSGRVFGLPVRSLAGTSIFPCGRVSVFETGTDDRVQLYADPALSVHIANPQQANGAGYFIAIYLDIAAGAVDVEIADIDGNTVRQSTNLTLHNLPLTLGDLTAYSLSGEPLDAAVMSFYEDRTDVLADLFSDVGLTAPAVNPLTADALGAFDAVYLTPQKTYRVVLNDGAGELQFDVSGASGDFGVPDAPVLSGSVTDFVANISWTTPTSHFPIAGYRLYNADTDALIVDQVGNTYASAFLGPSATVRYYVVAYDTHAQSSPHSNTLELTTPASGTIVDTYTSSDTWIKRLGLTSIDVVGRGCGGGGGGGGGGPSPARKGGGAGGGGYFAFSLAAASLGSTETVTIGVPGTGGASVASGVGGVGGNPGTSGTDTKFGTWATAHGGVGGLQFTGSGPGGSAGGTASVSGGGPTSVTSESGGNGYKENPGQAPGDTTHAGAGGGQADSQAGGTSGDGSDGGDGGLGVMDGPGIAGEDGHDFGGGGGGGGAAGTGLISGGPLSGKGGNGGRAKIVITNHIG